MTRPENCKRCRSFESRPPWLRSWPLILQAPVVAVLSFNGGFGWAIASHIALSTLTSLFPFLIFVTALAGVFGSRGLANEAGKLLLETWPSVVAAPIAEELGQVANRAPKDALTIGLVLSVYFSASGIESLRIGLNGSYGVQETRSWWLLRLESILYVVLSAVGILVLAVLIVFGPLIIEAVSPLRELIALKPVITFARFFLASAVLTLILCFVHYWLPAGRRRFVDIFPGVVVTLFLWLVSGAAFGRYLLRFPNEYVLTYAGLASVMIALVFLYFSAAIFLYGGDLNATIMRLKREKDDDAGDGEIQGGSCASCGISGETSL